MTCEELDLGGFKVDIKQVVKQIKCDLKDDWYPDSLGYEDMLEPHHIGDLITKSLDLNDGLFIPNLRATLNIPKKGFVLRSSLECSITERIYYHALVTQLVPFYDPLLAPVVLSSRYAADGDRYGRYLFLHPIEQWKLFNGYISHEAKNKNIIIVTDISNYYDNIHIDRLVEILRQRVSIVKATGADKGHIRNVIEKLKDCLCRLCYTTQHGLPQNRDASSFLGNIFMMGIDEAMLHQGYNYFRYMDDIRIITSSKYKAREALQYLIIELRKIGLYVNSAKTKILEPGMDEYRDILTPSEREIEVIDDMWKSRSVHVIRRSLGPLKELALKLIKEKRTDEKAFRFCITKLANLALCQDIVVPEEYYEPMIKAAINNLDDQPHSTDQLVKFLKAAPTNQKHNSKIAEFLCDKNRAIYDWQNYLLWQLLVYKKHYDSELIAIAKKRVSLLSLKADRAGAMLFLGAAGKECDRQMIVDHFHECDHHLLQRNALIAVHEVPFNDGIKQNVARHVIPCLKGAYTRIRDKYNGRYFLPLPPVKIFDIYDEVTSYD